MSKVLVVSLLLGLSAGLAATPSAADQVDIQSALSAGPVSLTKNATIMRWNGEVLREGTNGWTCLPDMPGNSGVDPYCIDASWSNLIDALVNNKEPSFEKLGIAYMLAGDAPVSNIRPGGEKSEGDWVEGLKAHLMILVPDKSMYDNIPTDPENGGPWIMWPGTPYEHIMVPIDSYPNE